jgi:putative endonuclease
MRKQKKDPHGWFVYMLECGDWSLYTGVTNNVPARLARHRAGKGARYTRGRLPLRLVYTEVLPDKSGACKREYAIKQLTGMKKRELVRQKTGKPRDRRRRGAHKKTTPPATS